MIGVDLCYLLSVGFCMFMIDGSGRGGNACLNL